MRDKLGRFIKGHPFGKRFKKGHISWNKNKYGYSTTKKGKRFPGFSGKNNPAWKGGKITDKDGYIWLRDTNHPFNHNGYVKRSRLVMEKHLGHYLKPEEVVHHKGIKYSIDSIENKQDDRIENLKLLTNLSEHRKFHNPRLKY